MYKCSQVVPRLNISGISASTPKFFFFIREAEIVQETSCCVAVKMSSSVRNIMLRSSEDVVQCKKHHVA